MAFCFACDQTFDEGKTPDVKIKCKICDKQFHLKCVNISSVLHKSISANNNIWWSCDMCSKFCAFFEFMTEKLNNLVTEVAQNTSKLTEQEKTLNEIREATKIRLNLNKTPNVSGTPKRSYAKTLSDEDQVNAQQSLKTRRIVQQPVIRDNDESILVIQAKDESLKPKLSSVVKSSLKHGVDPVQSINTTGQGKVVIHCKDPNAVTEIKNKLQTGIGDKVTVSEPKSVLPRIRLVGVDDEYINAQTETVERMDDDNDTESGNTEETKSYEQLINKLRTDNPDCFDTQSTLTVVLVKKRFNQMRYDVILSTDTTSFKKILTKQKLRIDWELYPVHEQLNVIRCYKCNNYGHVANECKQQEFTCPKCAGNHNVKDCDATNSKCVNCIRANEQLNKNLPTNHPVWSIDCPVYVHKLEMKRKRVRYSK